MFSRQHNLTCHERLPVKYVFRPRAEYFIPHVAQTVIRANGDDEEFAMRELCHKLNVIQAQMLQEWRLQPHMRDDEASE